MSIFKPKYKFNNETLQYEKINFSLKGFLIKSIPHLALSTALALGFVALYMLIFDSPKERYLRAKNKFLTENFEYMNARLIENEDFIDKLALRDNYFYRTAFNQDTIPMSLRNRGIGGTDRYKHLDGYKSSDIVKQVARRLDQVERKLSIQSLSYQELDDAVRNHQHKFSSMPFLQPVHTSELIRIGSFFGYRVHPITRVRRFHKGVDLTAPSGTPVYASGDGIIKRVEENRSRRGYGNLIIIDHQINGITTRYAHLSDMKVKEGEKVARGQKIGTVGNTGLSTAPHLHYEIRINGSAVNPLRYMLTPEPEEYDELIRLALYDGLSFD